jgi:hypothetical protein
MSYEEKWKVLADLLIELQERGEKIPADVMHDLRSAKTMIQILKADPTHIESISRIDTYLRTVESFVIFTTEKHGKEIVDKWLKRLSIEKRVKSKEKETASRFVPGIPRNKTWVRIQISEDTPREEVEKLIEASELSYKMQENGHMIVYGNGKNIKSFVKLMAAKFRGARKG